LTIGGKKMKRNRSFYFVAGCIVVPLALASRQYSASLPEFLKKNSADTLWALMVFIVLGWIYPRWSTLRVSVSALLISYAVEISQLYHRPWIDNLRHTWLGGLILGYGFLWSDLVCYTIGVIFAAVVEFVASTVIKKNAPAR
jgi:hypothetical protein